MTWLRDLHYSHFTSCKIDSLIYDLEFSHMSQPDKKKTTFKNWSELKGNLLTISGIKFFRNCETKVGSYPFISTSDTF